MVSSENARNRAARRRDIIPIVESFGERLKRLRRERALTIPALAKLVGVTDSAIRQLESGESKSASFAVGLRLAHILEVDACVLAFGEGTSLGGRLLEIERRVTAIEAARAEEKRAAGYAASHEFARRRI